MGYFLVFCCHKLKALFSEFCMITKNFNISDSFSFDGKSLTHKSILYKTMRYTFSQNYSKDHEMYPYDDPDKPYYIPEEFGKNIIVQILQSNYIKNENLSTPIHSTNYNYNFKLNYYDYDSTKSSTYWLSKYYENEVVYNNPDIPWSFYIGDIDNQHQYISVQPIWLNPCYCKGYVRNDDIQMRFNAWFYYV